MTRQSLCFALSAYVHNVHQIKIQIFIPTLKASTSQRQPLVNHLHNNFRVMELSVPLPLPALVMSETSIPAESSSRFQAIFQAALTSYQEQTKKDLLTHPLASQLKACDSTTAILTILQHQVQEFDKSCSGDERLTKWLSATVDVLCAFSATISGGVSVVSLDSRVDVSLEALSDVYFAGIFTCECDIYRHWCPPISKYSIYCHRWIIFTSTIL